MSIYIRKKGTMNFGEKEKETGADTVPGTQLTR